MNILKELFNKTVDKFTENSITSSEARYEVYLLIEEVFGLTKKDLVINPYQEVPEDGVKRFNSFVKRRIEDKVPVQYLVNKAYFMGQIFYVNENVLIPRPETEILVEETLKLADDRAKIIDIGSGSGCIAIMLAEKLLQAEVFASDISEKALEVAKFNAEKLGVADRIKFLKSDIFEKIDPSENFDIIISNPPYIPVKEKEHLQIEVVRHEPEMALFTEDDTGVSFYGKLVNQAASRLNTGGFLAVETGIFQAEAVKEIFKNHGFKDIQIIKDLSGIDRVVIGKIIF